jgi:hypothetical protein
MPGLATILAGSGFVVKSTPFFSAEVNAASVVPVYQ